MSDSVLDQAAVVTKQQLHQDHTAAQQLAVTQKMQNLVVDIEKDLLEEIIKNLEENKISTEQAQQSAREFLAFLPIEDQKDLLEKLLKLSQSHQETQGIYLKYAKPYEDDEAQRKLHLMSQHIKQGKIEEALNVAKGGANVSTST